MPWDWMDYVPIVSGVKNAAEGDWADAAAGFTPFAPMYQGGKALYGSDLMQHDVLPALGLKKSPEEQALLDQMRRTATDYEQYRPQVAQARMNALRQGFELMSPYTRAMEQMYGPGAAADYSQLSSPLDPMHQPQQPTTMSRVSGGEAPARPRVQAGRGR